MLCVSFVWLVPMMSVCPLSSFWHRVWLVDRGDVGTRIRIGVRVARRASSAKDLARLVHNKDAAHGGADRVSDTCSYLRASSLGSIPVHIHRGTCLEDAAVLPGKEPGMVVLAPNAFAINGKHRLDLSSRQCFPGVGLGIVDLAVLALTRS